MAVVHAAGMSIAWSGFIRFAILALFMGLVSAWARWRLPDPRLGHAAAIVGTATAALMVCGLISNAGLRIGVPLIDPWLIAADAAVGVNVGDMIRAIAGMPALIASLSFVYNASGVAAVIVIAVLLARGSLGKAWEVTATAILAMQVVAALSVALPATGAAARFGLDALQGNGLPQGAGTYFWPAFAHFRFGTETVLRLEDMSGLVSFPSFHTVIALLVSQAAWHTKWRWPAALWTAVVILSAIPMGGHYVADLVAGGLVWGGCAAISRRATISSPSA